MERPPLILPQEFSFPLTRDLLKRRARCYLSRTAYREVSGICIAAALVALVGLFVDSDSHRRTIYRVLVFIPLWPAILYGMWYWGLSKIRHEDIDRKITVRLESAGLTVDHGDAVNSLRWQSIKRLWKFPEMYLVFLDARRPRFITLPTSVMSDDMKIYLEKKIGEHGGIVSARAFRILESQSAGQRAGGN